MSENTELVLNPDNPRERELLLNERTFAIEQRHAQALAASKIIPTNYQNNLPDCLIAQEMATRLGVGVLEIMQSLYVVYGRPAFSAAYMIARVNASNILTGRLRFEFNEDRTECTAMGTCAKTGEALVGTTISMALAEKEGWTKKNGSKWQTMPEQMLIYRAGSFWARAYAPDLVLGMQTVEEITDTVQEKIINPMPAANDLLNRPDVTQDEVDTLLQEPEPEKKKPARKKTKAPTDDELVNGNGWLQALITRIEMADSAEEIDKLATTQPQRALTDPEKDLLHRVCTSAYDRIGKQ